MFYASKVGLNQIYDRICHYWREHRELKDASPMKKKVLVSSKHIEGDFANLSSPIMFFAAMSPHWTPSKLLKRLAEKNVPIGEWAAHKKSFSRL